MTWKLAPALGILRAQVDKAMPNRSKASDGTIGDAAHQAEHSDHNPNAAGIVCAWDCTATPTNPVWQKLADDIVEDSRVNYVIFNRRIRYHGEAHWRPYTGASAHTEHIHASLRQSSVAWNSTRVWDLHRFAPAPVVTPPSPQPAYNRVVTWASAYIRLNPSIRSKVLATVHKDDKLIAIPGGTVLWAKIKGRGFILRSRVKTI
jgi:hypothetical protein